MRNLYYKTTLNKQIQEKRSDRRERIEGDIELYGRDILDSEEIKEAYEQKHHLWSTVGEHTLRVTATSVMVCYALRKLHIKANIPAVVVGSLCHDLGILGREKKYGSSRECAQEHPADSVKVARELVPDLSDTSADIIERHMWPAGGSQAPNSIEGIIVSAADKYSAVKDLVKGSDVHNTGIRNLAREKAEHVREQADRIREQTETVKEMVSKYGKQ